MFSGWLHGDQSHLSEVRSFLGLCQRLPESEIWQDFFEKGVIERDGFVPRSWYLIANHFLSWMWGNELWDAVRTHIEQNLQNAGSDIGHCSETTVLCELSSACAI